MTPNDPTIAVLFADVAGSTRLYEQVGDALALATIGKCLALVEEVSRGHGGRLIKTIGDEAMVVFPAADQAAAAAAEIQGRMTDFAQAGNYRIAFRIGFHCGAAIERDGDVFGDSVNVAARMVGLAKSGQVILSAPTAEALSAALRERLREVDVMTVKGKEKDIGILELLVAGLRRPHVDGAAAAAEGRRASRCATASARSSYPMPRRRSRWGATRRTTS